MAQSWQTIEQAAVSLGLSVRTVNRHIAAGKIESRLTEGRREVVVSLPDGPAAIGVDAGQTGEASLSPPGGLASDAPASDNPPGAAHDSGGQAPSATPAGAQGGLGFDPETVLALADNAAEKAEMAVAAYQALARMADTQAQQVRRAARVAWVAVAAMAASVTVAVGWTAHRLTRSTVEIEHSKGEIEHLRGAVASGRETADKLSAERAALAAEMAAKHDALRTDLATAREQAARTEGKLAAFIEQDEQRVARDRALTASAPPLSPLLSLDPTIGLTGASGAGWRDGASPGAQPADAQTSGTGVTSTDSGSATTDHGSDDGADAPPAKAEVRALKADGASVKATPARRKSNTPNTRASDTSSASTSTER